MIDEHPSDERPAADTPTSGAAIHRQWFEPDEPSASAAAPGCPIVLLHEGLGSISAWGPFPGALARATGLRVLAYDRRGYGRSAAQPAPWPARYMHREAAWLPFLLAQERIDREMILVGHSDGASIALLYPSQAPVGSPQPRGIVSLSAHLLVEEVGAAAIETMRRTYTANLASRLARHHDDADATFEAWSEVWVSDRFRSWTLDDEVRAVQCPVLAIQGATDGYGTSIHLDRIVAAASGSVEVHELPGVDHWPHREATVDVLDLITRFCRRLGL